MVTSFHDLMTYNERAQFYQKRVGRKFSYLGAYYILAGVSGREGTYSNSIHLKVLCLKEKQINLSNDIRHLSTDLFKFEYDKKYDINTIEVLYGEEFL